MYFLNVINNIIDDKKTIIFVDMDGVIADYDVGHPYDFKNKRPLFSRIKLLEEISKMNNVELHILSIGRKNTDIKDKNDWLDEYAPFFKKEYRMIISKENIPGIKSKDIKTSFLKDYIKTTEDRIILIEDDNDILKQVRKEIPSIILFQDSALTE